MGEPAAISNDARTVATKARIRSFATPEVRIPLPRPLEHGPPIIIGAGDGANGGTEAIAPLAEADRRERVPALLHHLMEQRVVAEREAPFHLEGEGSWTAGPVGLNNDVVQRMPRVGPLDTHRPGDVVRESTNCAAD